MISKFIISQTGIPRNMYVAKFLHDKGLLDKLFTDTYYSKKNFSAKLPFIGKKINNVLSKYDPDFSNTYISWNTLDAIIFRFLLQNNYRIKAFSYARKKLNDRVLKYASTKTAGKFYGFDTMSLEFLEWANKHEWVGYLEQCVAPRTAQIEMWKLFREKYSINTKPQIEFALYQQEIERKEWEYATKIIVPSSYVKSEMMKANNVQSDKIEIINYGYSAEKESNYIKNEIEKKYGKINQAIRILFAGNAGYRKGIADVLEIANDFKNENINFIIAGYLEKEAVSLIKEYSNPNVFYVGKLSKEQLAQEYLDADIFLFPSYLEGSAMVLMEAMSWGLPIITTYQSGSVIQNDYNGLLSNAGDLPAIKQNLASLIFDRDLRFKMSIRALEESSKYSMHTYSKNLLSVLLN